MTRNELLNLMGTTLLPPVTIAVAGYVGRCLTVAVKGDLNSPAATFPFYSQLVFIAIHIICLIIIRSWK